MGGRRSAPGPDWTPARAAQSGRGATGRGAAGRVAASGETDGSADALLGVAAVVALVATGLVGTVAAGAFILSGLLLVALRPGRASADLLRFWPLLLLPLLASLSTLWSEAPERSLRAGLQLLLTILAAIIVSRRLSVRAMILTLFCCHVVVIVLALPEAAGKLGSGVPLIGPFASKNQMGFAAQMLQALSLVVAVDRQQPGVARLTAVAMIPLTLLLVVLSQSSGALVSAALTFGTFGAIAIFGRLSMALRLAVLAFTVLLGFLGLMLLPEIEAALADFRLNVLKKDATLTGRTYLWAFAEQLISERPWLGHGYNAFWRQGNLEAEGLWRWGGIASRTGFNFHNAFVEMQVDLGRVGLIVFMGLCAGVLGAALYRQLVAPSLSMAFLVSYLLVMYSRNFTENGLIAPFSLVTFLWVATAVHALVPAPPAARSAARSAMPRRPIGSRRRGRQPRFPAQA